MSNILRNRLWSNPVALAFILAASMVLMGCGPTVGTVRGVVSHGGKPIEGGSVLFYFDDGRSIGGEVLGDGNYAIENAPLGHAKVVVLPAAEGDQAAQHMAIKNDMGKSPPPKPEPKFPEKYSDLATTDLTCRIDPGENKFDIDLK
jgi:hypothetical protein